MRRFYNQLKILFTDQDKKFIAVLLLFSVCVSCIETVGISAIMPFMTVAADFSKVQSEGYIKKFYDYFSFNEEVDFVISFGIVLIIFYIIRGIINLFYFHCLARFSYGNYHKITTRTFQNFLGMPYHNFTTKNTSYMTKSIVNEAATIAQMMQGLLLLVSESLVTLFIYGMLLYVSWKITLGLTLFIIVMGGLMLFLLMKKVKREGTKREHIQGVFYEIINKAFSNFKLLKTSRAKGQIENEFNEASYNYARVNIRSITLQSIPRLFIESTGFSLIILFVTVMVYITSGDISSFMGKISIFVLGLYRLLPSTNRMISAINEIAYNKKAMDVICDDLSESKEVLGEKEIIFSDRVNFYDVSFSYSESSLVLKNLNFSLKKGKNIAFVGESGSGKSTLIDLIIGLLNPTKGKVLIDEAKLDNQNALAWRNKIGYIPQEVFLFEGNVADNIVFGREYNEKKIVDCLIKANIYDFLSTKEGIKTRVGDRGVLLSGGQKQRIAIARMLYGEPEIIILDEATSALDSLTEKKIMDEIFNITKDKTLVIITHRLSSIKNCDEIYELKNGQVVLQDNGQTEFK